MDAVLIRTSSLEISFLLYQTQIPTLVSTHSHLRLNTPIYSEHPSNFSEVGIQDDRYRVSCITWYASISISLVLAYCYVESESQIRRLDGSGRRLNSVSSYVWMRFRQLMWDYTYSTFSPWMIYILMRVQNMEAVVWDKRCKIKALKTTKLLCSGRFSNTETLALIYNVVS